MGETVDALVVGASSLFLRYGSQVISMILFKVATMDLESAVEVYRLLYVLSLMTGTHPIQTKTQST